MSFGFLAALQPYKSSCPPLSKKEKRQKFFQLYSLVIKTKLVQNVNRMSERQNNMPKDRLTDRQIEDKTTFQLSYQNKSCSECQQDVRKIERQTDKNMNHDRQLKSRPALVLTSSSAAAPPVPLTLHPCNDVRETLSFSMVYNTHAYQ